jgi:hypothetical protein
MVTSQQFFVSHTIRKTEIPDSVGSWVTNTLSVKILCPQTIVCLMFSQAHNMLTCWYVENWPSFFCLSKTVVDYENFCLMNDIIYNHWHMENFCQVFYLELNSL